MCSRDRNYVFKNNAVNSRTFKGTQIKYSNSRTFGGFVGGQGSLGVIRVYDFSPWFSLLLLMLVSRRECAGQDLRVVRLGLFVCLFVCPCM